MEDNLNINDKVVYYIGDRDSNLKKLKHKWSGPWRVSERVYPNVVILSNDSNGGKFDAHVQRVKKYKSREFWKLSQYEKMVNNNEVSDIIE